MCEIKNKILKNRIFRVDNKAKSGSLIAAPDIDAAIQIAFVKGAARKIGNLKACDVTEDFMKRLESISCDMKTLEDVIQGGDVGFVAVQGYSISIKELAEAANTGTLPASRRSKVVFTPVVLS